MQISEATLEAVKEVVYEIFDNGKVKDVTMRLGRSWYGDEVVCVRLYFVPDTSMEDFEKRMFPLPRTIREVLGEDLKDLLSRVEVQTI